MYVCMYVYPHTLLYVFRVLTVTGWCCRIPVSISLTEQLLLSGDFVASLTEIVDGVIDVLSDGGGEREAICHVQVQAQAVYR